MTGHRIPDAPALLAIARERTGIGITDTAALEPLSRLVESLNTEGQLHEAGAEAMTGRLLRILSNRLRMQRDFAAHPEIADERIDAPLFICGMARTGSTKTQKMLAASGCFNWLPYWQVLNPSLLSGDRGESPDERIADVDAFVRYFDAASPKAHAAHAFETHEPEEESFILEHSLLTPTFLGWAPMSSYLDWLMTQDLTAHFRQLRDTLKYLQWQGLHDRSRRWVLKSPLYSGLEPLLLQIFPDARLAMTHRDPRQTIASGLKLLRAFHKPFSTAIPDTDYYVAGQASAAAAHLAAREALPAGTFLDIPFARVVGDVAALVTDIFRFCGLPEHPDAVARVLAWDAANPKHKRGEHRYTLGEFGLTEDAIARDFADYITFLDTVPSAPRS
jgi:hypothetical protein